MMRRTCLSGGGQAGTLLRAVDWPNNPLGPVEAWPLSLQAAVRIVLNSDFPMMLHWGPEFITVYNDAYAPSLGRKHPGNLGRPAFEWWSEMWDQLAPIFEKVLAGEAYFVEDARYTPDRDGTPEEAFFTHCHSPLWNDDGTVAGIFLVVSETTRRVTAERELKRANEALERQFRASEAGAMRLSAFVSASSEVLYSMSADWREMRQLSGGTFLADTRTANPDWVDDYIPPEEQTRVQTAIAEAIASKALFSLEHRVRRADGGVGFTLSRAAPILDEAGAITEWFGAASDVTARREAERELRELNETLEEHVRQRTAEVNRLWNTSPDLLLVIDFDGVFRRVNPSWTTLLGYGPDELVGHHVNEFVVQHDHAETVEAYTLAAQGGLPKLVNRFRHKDGTLRWISWVGAPEGRMTYATGRDITAEKQREAVLRDTQDFARLALSAVGGVGVWTFDPASDTFSYDAAVAKLYAIDPERGAMGIPRTEFLANVHPDDRAALTSTMASGLARPGDLELEYRLCHPDGSVHWVLSRGHTYHDDEGRPVRRTGIGVETTNQRQIEEALRQSQKMEAVGQLTGGVAHDFNNLLTIIRSSVDFLRRPELPEARKARYLDAVSETVDRAAKLTGQLLAFARRQALKPEVFDVGARLRGIADMIDTLTGARVRVLTHVPDEPCLVRADLSQFETALVNMAVNARDAMDGEGTLTLRLTSGASMPAIRGHAGSRSAFAAVSLRDTGSGIGPDQIVRIFEPFFTTKAVGKGTGLGLSQVFGFAKQSGGDVDVESTPVQGTTFTLYLPQVTGEPAEARGQEEQAEHASVGIGQRVLVIEDNVEVGRFCTQILEDLGYRTTWAANAEEALVNIGDEGGDFDVVFSDVVMPGIGGLALAKDLRRRLPDLPVVLASGYSHVLAQDDAHGFELLHKPYSAEQLSKILRRVTAAKPRRDRQPAG